MIEKVIKNYLDESNLSATVYMEQPKIKPSKFYLIEKSGGGLTDHINKSTFIIQSNGTSLYEAAELNEEIKAVMLNAITLDEISKVDLNSDYNYTDSTTKTYRYQAVFVVTHY